MQEIEFFVVVGANSEFSVNGWGTYKNFVPWVAKYLAACEEYPDADVSVSR